MNDDDIRDFGDSEDDLPPEAQAQLTWAMMEFNGKFSEYIKEMNPELWKKAVDYAVTFTKVNGITFEYVKTDTTEDVIANVDIDELDDIDIEYEDEDDDADKWTDLEDDAQ